MRKKLALKICVLLTAAFSAVCCAEAENASDAAGNTVSMESQAIELDGVQNARQLGGYVCADGRKIKDGVLLRSAALDTLTGKGAETLSEEYNLKYIFDFRMTSERDAQPDAEVPGAENLSLPVFSSVLYDEETLIDIKNARENGEDVSLVLARNGGLSAIYKKMLLTEEGQSAYAQFFDTLLQMNEGEAALWHCTQGKDRAGMAAVLLLYALGADEETIVQDYLLTNEAYSDLIAETEAKAEKLGLSDEETKEYVGLVGSVSEDFLRLALDSVEAEYGSVQDYLKNQLDLSDEDMETLRDLFLES